MTLPVKPYFRFLLALLLAGLLTGLQQQAGAQNFAAIPPLSSHVVDQVHLLDEQQRHTLDQVLTEYEARSGSQIAVLLVSSTAPEAIEQYSIRVAEAWKLGRKGVDDGVILLVAKDNDRALRRLRIEAGRGVQGSLTDARSKRILEDVIAPHFRQNDYYGGLAAGVSALTSVLDEEHLPAAQTKPASDDNGGWLNVMAPVIFLIIFFVVIMVVRSRGRSSNNLNSNSWGNHTTGVIIGSLLNELARSGSSGGSGRSGGSSGGGFSGGGGSFDGGGASGDW